MKTLWNDESGVIVSAEIVLVGTILVLGMITGLVELQAAVIYELTDLSDALVIWIRLSKLADSRRGKTTPVTTRLAPKVRGIMT